MIHLTQNLTDEVGSGLSPSGEVRLSFDQRARSRLRAMLEDGREVAIELERGGRLRPGQLLGSTNGDVIRVNAADEKLSRVHSDDQHLLARACYHLGNRHVALQINPTSLCYLHDHVLDDMVSLLGLEIETVDGPFEPEPGAYGGGHSHAHSH